MMESIACDYCGADRSSEVVRQTDRLHRTTQEYFSLVKCGSCNLHYLNPRPTRQEIGRYYATEYAFHAASSRIKLMLLDWLDWMANGPLRYFFSLIPRLNRRLAMYVRPQICDAVRDYYRLGGAGAFLDIGCGSGESAHFWGRRGSLLSYKKFTEVCGVEIADAARQHLAVHGIEAYANLDEVPIEKLFGAIRMNWSLEHVHAPSVYFRFIHDHLLPGGIAIIAIPNYGGLIYKLAPDCVEVPIHLYHFCVADVKNYAKKFGFTVKSLRTFSFPQMFVAAAECGLFVESFAAGFSHREALAFQKFLNRFDASNLGNDMIVVLEKN